ncbi:alpha/beta hydrolase [Ruminococcaceae bacterium OttesenSCG-928-I18]|nr:alpha/beta hydrolase [Ruminococcaceae bacterium OttesenSCG-928-I18]
MRPTEKRGIRFESADGRGVISGVFFENPDVEPFCLLQISHGMCEYMGRYAHFAEYCARNGVVVFGNDHIGHGASAGCVDDLGYFGEKGARRFAIRDLKIMNQMAKEAYPELPVVLLGHSMGSFFARQYAVQWPDTIEGLILSGTGGPNPMAGGGVAITKAMMKWRGDRHRSKFVEGLVFGAYLNEIQQPRTRYDWVSSDIEVVRQYVSDPYCNFHFTLSGFHELFSALREVSSPAWAVQIKKTMPIMIFSGAEDPVGDHGKGVKKVYDWLRGAGVKHIEYRLYPGGRHEMLNEVNREEVYEDILAFLKRWYGQ